MNAVRLASGLLKQRIRPTYLVTRGPGPYAPYLPGDAEVIVLDTGRVNSSTLRLARSIRPLAALIDARKPAVLMPVMPSPSLVALRAARLAQHRVRTLLSIQNTLQPPRAGGLHLVKRIEFQLMQRWFADADGVVALSSGVAADLLRVVPTLDGRVSVVPNVGLPLAHQLDVVDEMPSAKLPGRIRILACGRLVEQKGYPYLIDAFACVCSQVNAELHILGDGPLRPQIIRQVERLGLQDRVTLLGFRRNPYKHMEAADVFVLSSLWEGFGNVLVEAMSMGTAVVSTRCPHGPDEIITQGESGLLVPPADAAALASAMLQLAKDEPLRDTLATQGRQRAAEFSADEIAASYADVIRRHCEA